MSTLQERRSNAFKSLADRIEALEAENAALRVDAERYRWMRTHENWRDSGPFDLLYEDELDAAIDEARSKT